MPKEISTRPPMGLADDETGLMVVLYDSDAVGDERLKIAPLSKIRSIVNDLDSDAIDRPLSAKQGKTLKAWLQQIEASGGGGGTGGPSSPPSLPDTAEFIVPFNRPNRSIAAFVQPLQTGSPAPTYSITPVAGLDVLPATGDLIITNSTTLMSALDAGSITTTLTAQNTLGLDTCTITLTRGEDYPSIDHLTSNMALFFDMMDNRQLKVNNVNLITEWFDKSPEERHTHNERWETSQPKFLQYIGNSLLGTGKAAARNIANTSATTGLMFEQNPVLVGLRMFGLRTPTRLECWFDREYPLSSSLGSAVVAAESSLPCNFDVTTPLVGRPLLLSIIWTTTQARLYDNGVLASTVTLPVPVLYPGQAYILIIGLPLQTAFMVLRCFGNNCLMNNRNWRHIPLLGTSVLFLQFINVNESVGTSQGLIQARTTSHSRRPADAVRPDRLGCGPPITVPASMLLRRSLFQNGLAKIKAVVSRPMLSHGRQQ